jgi:hypothetical protein
VHLGLNACHLTKVTAHCAITAMRCCAEPMAKRLFSAPTTMCAMFSRAASDSTWTAGYPTEMSKWAGRASFAASITKSLKGPVKLSRSCAHECRRLAVSLLFARLKYGDNVQLAIDLPRQSKGEIECLVPNLAWVISAHDAVCHRRSRRRGAPAAPRALAPQGKSPRRDKSVARDCAATTPLRVFPNG